MMHRRTFLMALLAAPASAIAQPRRFRVGWLVFGDPSLGAVDRSLQDALRQRGLVDKGTIEVIYRYANGAPARLAELASELVAHNPDMLLAVGGDVVKALFDASKGGIPIVGGVSDSPVRAGIAASLARPGKNFTGVTYLTDEMAAKRIGLLKEAAPDTKRVAVIFNPLHLDDELTFARRGAESLGIGLTAHPIRSISDLDAALRAASAHGADSVFVIASRLTNVLAAKIAEYGRAHRLPVIAPWGEFVTSGCLLSYGPNRAFESTHVARYVEQILKGAKPADLPIQQPTKFELVVNLKTAQTVGLRISQSLLQRADQIIE